MEDLDKITDEYDREFISLMIDIEKRSEVLNKYDKLRIKNWCKKLCQITKNIEWKKNRNLHAICILDSILNEHFEEPYNKFPPEDNVPILNKSLVKSRLSKKFFEESIKIQNEEQLKQIIEENQNYNSGNNSINIDSDNISLNHNNNKLRFKNNNEFNNTKKNDDQSVEIINKQQKEINRLNDVLKQKDLEIDTLIREKGQMQKHIQELEQMIGKFMEIEESNDN